MFCPAHLAPVGGGGGGVGVTTLADDKAGWLLDPHRAQGEPKAVSRWGSARRPIPAYPSTIMAFEEKKVDGEGTHQRPCLQWRCETGACRGEGGIPSVSQKDLQGGCPASGGVRWAVGELTPVKKIRMNLGSGVRSGSRV